MGFKKCPLSEQNFCTTDEFRLRIRWRDTLVHFYLSSNFHTCSEYLPVLTFFSKCCIWKEARICCCNTKLVNSPHLWMCLIPNTHKRTALFLEETWTKLKRSCYLVFTHADGVRKNFYQWSTLFAFHPFIQLLHHSLVLTWILFFRPFYET